MYPAYLLVGLINIFAKHNNYNIHNDNETAILRARRSLSDDVIQEATDFYNNYKNNEETRPKREIKHYFYKNNTNDENYGSQNGYNSPQNNGITNGIFPNYIQTDDPRKTNITQQINGYNVTVANSYWNNPGQHYNRYNNTFRYGYNANFPKPSINGYYNSNGSYSTGYSRYNTYSNSYTNGLNLTGPVYSNTPRYFNSAYSGYNLPRYNYSSTNYHNFYKPGYNATVTNNNLYPRYNDNLTSNGYFGYNNVEFNSSTTNNSKVSKVASGVTTSTEKIVPGCIICNIGCPAFMKKIGIVCVQTNQEGYDYPTE